MTAPGYTNGTSTVTVNPSGFVINPSQGNINTTTFSTPTTVTLEPAILSPGTLTYAGGGQLTPGIGPFDVSITSSNLATVAPSRPARWCSMAATPRTRRPSSPSPPERRPLPWAPTPPAGFSLPGELSVDYGDGDRA